MKKFDPIKNIEDSHLILDHGEWPNFHDAEVHNLNVRRGDTRPEDNVWIGPVIEVSFELCALERRNRVEEIGSRRNRVRLELFLLDDMVLDQGLRLLDKHSSRSIWA